jgi:hypothetical protein
MDVQNVGKREILDYTQFLGKVHDDTYKPFAPVNQKVQREKSGLSTIQRQPAFDFVGYADAVFGNTSKIDVPGYRTSSPDGNFKSDAGSFGNVFNMDTSESEDYDSMYKGNSYIRRLSDF